MIKVDDRVQLVRRIANGASKRAGRRHGASWIGRRGTVVRVTNGGAIVGIRWDGRRSEDQWPVKALEVIPAGVVQA
ncbi:hypothetical protein H8A97_30400 [Bradyrhizobium sp. Arg62]|uniref:hypothetical protein n=1 Tax=Bradyrhizobium brasilense TaxID=1419277 RepID=UPI001E5F4590|nr:hypothetical protein [Bradyrhizobium brasilense]MCC8949297.1 hypothetical protein [Bradyrhizobium brasilense]